MLGLVVCRYIDELGCPVFLASIAYTKASSFSSSCQRPGGIEITSLK